MEDDRRVYFWHDEQCAWLPITAARLVCPECGRAYGEMWWEEIIAGEPHIQCPCGEQFSTSHPDH